MTDITITDRANMRALLAVADALDHLPEVERAHMDMGRNLATVDATLPRGRHVVFVINSDYPNILTSTWHDTSLYEEVMARTRDMTKTWPGNYYDMSGLDDEQVGRIAVEETQAFQRMGDLDRVRLWGTFRRLASSVSSLPGPIPAEWHGRFAAWRLHSDDGTHPDR